MLRDSVVVRTRLRAIACEHRRFPGFRFTPPRRRQATAGNKSAFASYDNHGKILYGFPFLSHNDYGAPPELCYKMKQSHWLLCVAKDCDWSRKITPLSNLSRASLLME